MTCLEMLAACVIYLGFSDVTLLVTVRLGCLLTCSYQRIESWELSATYLGFVANGRPLTESLSGT